MHSQIFRQVIRKIRRQAAACQGFFVQDDGKSASRFGAKAGDIFLIRPNMPHSVDSRSRMVYDTIVFSQDMLISSANDRSIPQIIYPLITGAMKISLPTDRDNVYYDEIRTSAENIAACAKSNTPLHDMLMKSELLRLI